jgi:hypothetical protein
LVISDQPPLSSPTRLDADGFSYTPVHTVAGVGLGVPDREVQLSGQDPREEVLLLLVGAVAHDRRADGVERQVRDGHTRHCGRVGEDQLLHHGAVLTAELLRPADPEPAVAADPADHVLVDPRVAELAGGSRQAGADLGCDQVGEVLAQLFAEAFLLRGQRDVHAARLERVLVLVHTGVHD